MKKPKIESTVVNIRLHKDIYEKYCKICQQKGWTKSRKLIDKVHEIINDKKIAK